MSILIKGMEMPKERESFTLTIKYNGLVFDTETGIQVAEAHELLPHGRLIDADVMRIKIDAPEDKKRLLVQWVDAQETVIKAEEGEK